MGQNLKWFGRHPKYFKSIILEILSSWTLSTKWRAYFSPKNCWQEANWENSSNVSIWLLSVMKSKGWYRQQKQKNKGWNVSTKETSDLLFCTYSVQFSSVTQSCLTLCDPMNRSTPDLPVHHQLPEFIQTHVHQADHAIQPSHPLLSPSPPAPNPSQHQGLFQWVNSSHEVAKLLEFQHQHQAVQWTPRTDLL